MRKLAASLLATLPLAVAAQDPVPQPTARHRRDTWYIGFGVGGADGRIKNGSGTLSLEEHLGERPVTGAARFGVGATLTPKLLLGFDMAVVRAEAGGSKAFGITNYDAVATFFPTYQGFFVRGGAGLSRNSSGEAGTNVTVGTGYAFWLGDAFNLTVNSDYSAQFWGNDGESGALQRSGFWALGLGFDWY